MDGAPFCTWQQQQLWELDGLRDAAVFEGEGSDIPACILANGALLGVRACISP